MAVTRVQIPSGVVSVLTAVQHFQRWHRNDVFVPIGQVTVKRYFALSSNGFGCSDGDTQNGIGAESFIGSAVKLNYLNSGPKILITAHPRTADPKNR